MNRMQCFFASIIGGIFLTMYTIIVVYYLQQWGWIESRQLHIIACAIILY